MKRQQVELKGHEIEIHERIEEVKEEWIREGKRQSRDKKCHFAIIILNIKQFL